MKYLVKWTEEIDYQVEVEATSRKDAKSKAFTEDIYVEATPLPLGNERIVHDSIEAKEQA